MYSHYAFYARFVKLTLWLAFGHCSNLRASCGALLERWRILVALVCVAANIHLRSACGYSVWERSLRQHCPNKWSRKKCQGRTKPGDMYSERSAIIKGIDKTTWRLLLEPRRQWQPPCSDKQWWHTLSPTMAHDVTTATSQSEWPSEGGLLFVTCSDQHHCQTIAVVVRTYCCRLHNEVKNDA